MTEITVTAQANVFGLTAGQSATVERTEQIDGAIAAGLLAEGEPNPDQAVATVEDGKPVPVTVIPPTTGTDPDDAAADGNSGPGDLHAVPDILDPGETPTVDDIPAPTGESTVISPASPAGQAIRVPE